IRHDRLSISVASSTVLPPSIIAALTPSQPSSLKFGSSSSVGLHRGITGGIGRRYSDVDLELVSDEREWRCGKMSEFFNDVMPRSRVDDVYIKETRETREMRTGR